MFEDWGELKSFRTGGVKTLELGAYRFFFWGGVFSLEGSAPYYIPWKKVFLKFYKIHWKTPLPECLTCKTPQVCNFIKTGLKHSCVFRKILRKSFLLNMQTAAFSSPNQITYKQKRFTFRNNMSEDWRLGWSMWLHEVGEFS